MICDMTTPCPQCPFRNDIPGFLRRVRAEEIIYGLLDLQAAFPCHKTVDYDSIEDEDDEDEDETNHQYTEGTRHCAGAMILLEKLNKPNQWMRWMERLSYYDRKKLDMEAPVFDTPEEFVDAQPF